MIVTISIIIACIHLIQSSSKLVCTEYVDIVDTAKSCPTWQPLG